ncbi:hypothetical protein EJB05_51174, partial [Eragrostis curvula]
MAGAAQRKQSNQPSPAHRRSLFSDPQFIAAHEARHPTPPLVVLGYHTTGLRCPDEQVVCDMVDLSGKVLRRVHAAGEVWVTSVNRDFVCTSKDSSYCIRLFNMKTGDVFALPEESSEEHAEERDILEFTSVAAIGQVASTGEHKVLRVLDSFDESDQLCEVFNLDGSSHARWRAKKAPPTPVSMTQSVVVNNIVYFFDYPEEDIASFDLEREEWMPVLQGLHYQQVRTNGNSTELSMAAVNGCLVLVHRYFSCYVDLWFLVDFERGLWEKRHSIRARLCDFTRTIRPVLVLNDGRISVFGRSRSRSCSAANRLNSGCSWGLQERVLMWFLRHLSVGIGAPHESAKVSDLVSDRCLSFLVAGGVTHGNRVTSLLLGVTDMFLE